MVFWLGESVEEMLSSDASSPFTVTLMLLAASSLSAVVPPFPHAASANDNAVNEIIPNFFFIKLNLFSIYYNYPNHYNLSYLKKRIYCLESDLPKDCHG